MGICLDEAIEPYKGRTTLKVYNPCKPHKWGIKLFVTTCIKTAFTLKLRISRANQPNL